MKKFFIIYITTNLINNKIYIGKHETINPLDEYMGSGKILKYSIKKYGKTNFKTEHIFYTFDRQSLMEYEQYFIEKFDSIKLGYNITKGGEGFHCKHTEESKHKMSVNRFDNSKDPLLNKSRSEKLKGIPHTKERIQAMQAGIIKCIRICKMCNKEYSRTANFKKKSDFCSQLCKIKYFNSLKEPKYKEVVCKQCNTLFRSNINEFCSEKCKNLFNCEVKICYICGNEFKTHGRSKINCSKECVIQYQKLYHKRKIHLK